jgi:hypothetical protein
VRRGVRVPGSAATTRAGLGVVPIGAPPGGGRALAPAAQRRAADQHHGPGRQLEAARGRKFSMADGTPERVSPGGARRPAAMRSAASSCARLSGATGRVHRLRVHLAGRCERSRPRRDVRAGAAPRRWSG